jgi:hypothetical protein
MFRVNSKYYSAYHRARFLQADSPVAGDTLTLF